MQGSCNSRVVFKTKMVKLLSTLSTPSLIRLTLMPTYTKESPRDAPKHSVLSFSSKCAIMPVIINLCRFLQEVGYEDIFNTNEVNEIKDLYNKAQAELTESIN